MEYGLLGEHLAHSYSKEIHEMLGAYRYELCEREPGELAAFFSAGGFRGLNVTIPYKREVIKYLDGCDEIASSIGAVNTIYFRDGKMLGSNTDYTGFLYMADRAGLDFAGRKVLIAGTGGASLMAQKAAADRGASSVAVAGRHGPVTYDRLPLDAQIIVNTTPVGTYPHNGEKLIDLSAFTNLEGVLDLIYNPSKTALLLQAEELGLKHSCGLPMLVAQATAAAELFTGKSGYSAENQRIISCLEHKMRNIVLIGMPGSGKTTIGKELARRLSLDFRDTDDLITERFGSTPEELIISRGEKGFRDLESRIISQITAEHGQVIATGGGAVLRPENRSALRQNGPVIFVKRQLADLDTAGRPLSLDLSAMYKKRLPLYESCSDFSLDNDGTVDETILELSAILP